MLAQRLAILHEVGSVLEEVIPTPRSLLHVTFQEI
jgi:hypothetical protein